MTTRMDEVETLYPGFSEWFDDQKAKGLINKRMQESKFQAACIGLALEATLTEKIENAIMAMALAIQLGIYMAEKEK